MATSSVHVLPLRVYFAVFFGLMAFTAVTVAAAFVNMGAMNNVIMMAIATIKATLVVLFFMHVRYNTRLIPVIIVSGLFFLLILFSLLFADYFSRGWLGVDGR